MWVGESSWPRDGRATAYGYDALHRPVSVLNALGGVTSYAYDPRSLLTELTDANGHARGYGWDGDRRLVGTVDPLGRTRAQTFDPAGNRVTLTDGNGNTSAYTYDALHRLTQISYADGGAVGYAYDRVGNRTAMFDSLGATSYGYDQLYRLVQTTDPFGATVRRGYDANGNRTATHYPPSFDNSELARTVRYAYDAADRLVRVQDFRGNGANARHEYQYDAVGNPLQADYSNGQRVRSTYDANNRLTDRQIVDTNNRLVSAFMYDYDASGNVVRSQTVGARDLGGPDDDIRYEYDRTHRLTASQDLTHHWSYGYDPAGNRTERLRTSLSDPLEQLRYTYAYDDADQLTALRRQGYDALTATWGDSPLTTFTYDRNGNETERARGSDYTSLRWTPANFLAEVREREGKGTDYAYDGDGTLYWERETNPSNHPDPGAGRTLTHTLDLANPNAGDEGPANHLLSLTPSNPSGTPCWVNPCALPVPMARRVLPGQHSRRTPSGLPLAAPIELPLPLDLLLGRSIDPGPRADWANDWDDRRPVDGVQSLTTSWNGALGQSYSAALTSSAFSHPGALDLHAPTGGAGAGPGFSLLPGSSPSGDPLKSPHASGLSVEQRGLSQILLTFSDDRQHGGPRQDSGTFVYGNERFAGFSSRKPREERYYGYDALGSNRTDTDERGRVAGTQSFDPWGIPDPGKHAGNEQGISLLTALLEHRAENRTLASIRPLHTVERRAPGAEHVRHWVYDSPTVSRDRPAHRDAHARASALRPRRHSPASAPPAPGAAESPRRRRAPADPLSYADGRGPKSAPRPPAAQLSRVPPRPWPRSGAQNADLPPVRGPGPHAVVRTTGHPAVGTPPRPACRDHSITTPGRTSPVPPHARPPHRHRSRHQSRVVATNSWHRYPLPLGATHPSNRPPARP